MDEIYSNARWGMMLAQSCFFDDLLDLFLFLICLPDHSGSLSIALPPDRMLQVPGDVLNPTP